MLRAGSMYHYEQDGLGSVTSLTNSSGSVAESYTYDSYGKLLSGGTTVANPFRYTAREWDTDAGLYYYRARYYDPTSGRFTAEDPLRFGAGTNFFTYVYNDPILFTDPFGLKIKYNKPAPYTVPPTGATLAALECLDDCLQKRTNNPNLVLLVTGGQENFGHTGPGSHHYKNQACDIAGPAINPVTHDDVMTCAKSCGFNAGQFEDFPGTRKDHWHLQINPGFGVPPIRVASGRKFDLRLTEEAVAVKQATKTLLSILVSSLNSTLNSKR